MEGAEVQWPVLFICSPSLSPCSFSSLPTLLDAPFLPFSSAAHLTSVAHLLHTPHPSPLSVEMSAVRSIFFKNHYLKVIYYQSHRDPDRMNASILDALCLRQCKSFVPVAGKGGSYVAVRSSQGKSARVSICPLLWDNNGREKISLTWYNSCWGKKRSALALAF